MVTLFLPLRAILLLSLLHSTVAIYTIKLSPAQKECFGINTPSTGPHIISGDFDMLTDEVNAEMIRGSLEEVAKKAEVWTSDSDEAEDTFSVSVEPGLKLQLCFESLYDNDNDDVKDIKVGFNIRVHKVPRTLPEGEKGPDAEMALSLIESAMDIEDEWDNLLDHFEYLREREAIHEKLTKQILARVVSWSMIEAGLVITMATCQVLYWKKFFEQRRYL